MDIYVLKQQTMDGGIIMKKFPKNKVFGNALRGAISEKSAEKRNELLFCPIGDAPQKVSSVADKPRKTPRKTDPTSGAKRNQFGKQNHLAKKKQHKKGNSVVPVASREDTEREADVFCSALGGINGEHEAGFFFSELLSLSRNHNVLRLIDMLAAKAIWKVVARKDIVFTLNGKIYALVIPRDMTFAEHRIRFAIKSMLAKVYTPKK